MRFPVCVQQMVFILCNSITDVSVIWKDGLHLTNDGTEVLANDYLEHLKCFQGNIDFNVILKI